MYAGVDPVSGRKKQVSRTTRGTVRDAEILLAQVVAEVADGDHLATEGTVAYILDQRLALLDRLARAGDRSPTTIRTYRGYVENNIKPAIGHIEARKLTARHLDEFYSALQAGQPDADPPRKPLSSSTIRQHHAIIASSLKQARKWGWVRRNVAEDATPPSMPRPVVQPPTVNEVRRLILEGTKRNPVATALLVVAATTGARRGELCGLRHSRLGLTDAGAHMKVTRNVIDLPGRVEEKDTKTHRNRRVSLDPFTVAVLRAHLAAQADLAETAGVELAADPYVFSQAVDGSAPYRPDRITGFFRRTRAALDLEHVKMHHLRHFMATQAIAAGQDIQRISGRLGHARTSTTLDIYAHFIPSSDQLIADHMGELLGGPMPAEEPDD